MIQRLLLNDEELLEKDSRLVPLHPVRPQEIILTAQQLEIKVKNNYESTDKVSSTVSNALNIVPMKGKRILYKIYAKGFKFHNDNAFMKAIGEYSSCIEMNELWSLPYYNRACSYREVKMWAKAVQDLNKALNIDNMNCLYLESRALIFREMGQYHESTADYIRLHQILKDRLVIDPVEESPSGDEKMETLWRILSMPSIDRSNYELKQVTISVKQLKYFKNLNDEIVLKLLKLGMLTSHSLNSYIVRQDDPADGFFIIIRGNVSIMNEILDGNGQVIRSVCLRKLQKGDCFGEPAVNANSRFRQASVVCNTETKCLSIDYKTYNEVLEQHQNSILWDRKSFFKRCKHFCTAEERFLKKISQLASSRTYQPGTVIVPYNQLVKELYVIQKGVCQVAKRIGISKATARLNDELTNQQKRSYYRKHLPVSSKKYLADTRTDSWIIDNGWHHIKGNPHRTQKGNAKKQTAVRYEDMTVATLASGQVFGESCILASNKLSEVKVTSITMVEVLVLRDVDLNDLNVQFNHDTMFSLQESLLFNNPPTAKVENMYEEKIMWKVDKARIIQDVVKSRSKNI